jgi:glutaredoxin
MKHGLVAGIAAVLLGLLALHPIDAHALYKVVHPDGRVTFTDRAPTDTASRVTSVTPGQSGGPSEVAVPYELRQVMQRFPVTLYVADKCDPCSLGRDLLSKRGVPFQERLVASAEDKAAMEQQVGSSSLPVMRVGGQTVPGFQASGWHSVLDAAGYPASSKLPINYKGSEATTVAMRAPKKEPVKPAAPVARTPDTTPAGTGGIRF